MACILNVGYSLGCRDNTGGIQKAYIRNWSAGTTYSYSSDGTITGSTAAGYTGGTWYTFEVRPETGMFDPGQGNHSLENGTNFWAQQLDLVLHKYQASVRTLLYALAQTEMEIIILDQNGNYILMGEQNGANLTASKASVGKAYGDMNGTTLTMIAKEPQPARLMSSTLFATFTLA
tara:strand:- start:2048 stop:2575 length:528 start_codon:yes stop_codon:yes gene_type:complete